MVDDRADNCLVIDRLLSPLGLLVREARNKWSRSYCCMGGMAAALDLDGYADAGDEWI